MVLHLKQVEAVARTVACTICLQYDALTKRVRKWFAAIKGHSNEYPHRRLEKRGDDIKRDCRKEAQYPHVAIKMRLEGWLGGVWAQDSSPVHVDVLDVGLQVAAAEYHTHTHNTQHIHTHVCTYVHTTPTVARAGRLGLSNAAKLLACVRVVRVPRKSWFAKYTVTSGMT